MRLPFESLQSLALIVLLRLARVPPPTCPLLSPFFAIDPLYLDSLLHVHCLPVDALHEVCVSVCLEQSRWPLVWSALLPSRPILASTWRLVFESLCRTRSPLLRLLVPALCLLARRFFRGGLPMLEDAGRLQTESIADSLSTRLEFRCF